jgi:glycosyltransferase involved in cell wall biosynthesis
MHNNSSITVLFASRLVHEKGVDILIRAIEKSIDCPYLIIWHIASDGLFESEIRTLARRYSERVIYHGKVSREKLANLYRNTDFLFMPSRFLETF